VPAGAFRKDKFLKELLMHMTARSPSPRPHVAAARLRCVVESFESRLMLHTVAPVIPVDDIVRLNTDNPDVIDLSQSFNAAANPTRVAFEFDAGRVIVELFESAAPRTVTNFLNYARSDRYDNTVVHRSAILGAPTFAPFVIQGGGYRASDLVHIPTDSPVLNEFRPNTQQRGTISMAKLGSNPNSATSEWFFNLRDNRDILDPQNSGFTSFGQVVGNGMTIVDAIAALPVIVQPAPAGDLSDFPVENEPPIAPQDFVNVDTIAELADLTTVTSDNPGLVTPVLQGTTLTLNYAAGVGGIANITINGVDRNGAPVTDVFQVRVPIISVPVGDGTPYRTLTYTDADGTAGAVTVTGGSATLRVGGTAMTQAPAGRNVAVSGTDLILASINVTGGTPSITVRGAGGTDQRLFVDGINGGAVRSFTGGNVILRGTSNIE
jgi:cyclophilin family peptidyl-prolyl cis-trans isomerase